MDKKKLGALIAALIAALSAFWYTYSSSDVAPVEPAPEVAAPAAAVETAVEVQPEAAAPAPVAAPAAEVVK